MKRFVVYDQQERVIRYGECQDNMVEAQAQPGERAEELAENAPTPVLYSPGYIIPEESVRNRVAIGNIFKIIMDQENRIRVLEGRDQLDAEGMNIAIKNM